jgi:hypothetical protein
MKEEILSNKAIDEVAALRRLVEVCQLTLTVLGLDKSPIASFCRGEDLSEMEWETMMTQTTIKSHSHVAYEALKESPFLRQQVSDFALDYYNSLEFEATTPTADAIDPSFDIYRTNTGIRASSLRTLWAQAKIVENLAQKIGWMCSDDLACIQLDDPDGPNGVRHNQNWDNCTSCIRPLPVCCCDPEFGRLDRLCDNDAFDIVKKALIDADLESLYEDFL